LETFKQLWRKEHPNQNFERDAGCRDHEFNHLGIIQKNCFNKKCSDCWNECVEEKDRSIDYEAKTANINLKMEGGHGTDIRTNNTGSKDQSDIKEYDY